jgi:hypothetical protein
MLSKGPVHLNKLIANVPLLDLFYRQIFSILMLNLLILLTNNDKIIRKYEICALLGYYLSVNNYHTTPDNIPEERRSHQHRGGGPKSKFENMFTFTLYLFIG